VFVFSHNMEHVNKLTRCWVVGQFNPGAHKDTSGQLGKLHTLFICMSDSIW